MKNREDILVIGKDGGYFYADCLDREPKHRAETAFRFWLEEHGKDGETYILAKWLSHEMTINVKRTIVSNEPTTLSETPVEPLVEKDKFATEAVQEITGEIPGFGDTPESLETEEIESIEQQEESPDDFPG